MERKRSVFCFLFSVFLVVVLAGCAASAEPAGEQTSSGQTVLEQAEAEATAIVERAEATAVVLRAQSTAVALIEDSNQPQPAPAQPPAATPAYSEQEESAEVSGDADEPEQATPEVRGTSGKVELLGVEFAAEGGFILVQFKAPPATARKWYQGKVYVLDEGTGVTYNEVPVMPKIGPLIGRPKVDGQLGYVMLVNAAPGLQSGALVTVVLGDFKQEHVRVQ